MEIIRAIHCIFANKESVQLASSARFRTPLCLFCLASLLATVSATAAAQTVTLSPASLNFGSVTVGSTSPVKNIILTNTGTAALTITSIAASASFSETNTCGPALGAGKKCGISVTFAPTQTGLDTGALTVTDNAGNSPQTVALSGTGLAQVTLAPATHNFGSLTVGSTSTPYSLTLINNQSTALSITSITVSGDFAETNTCGASLAADSSCEIYATFTPTVVGTRTGTLSVNDSGNNSPQTSSLSGTGSTAGLTSIAITPANSTIAAGYMEQFTATGTFSSGETYNITQSVNWNSSKKTVATVGNTAGTQGLATAIAAGATTITATSGKITGTTPMTVVPAALVSIAITPTAPSIALGTQQQFAATGTYSDGSTQNLTGSVAWSSSALNVATIAAGGLASSVGTGTTGISGTSGSVTGSATLTVTPASLVSIALTPAAPTITLGNTEQFTATGTYSDGSTQNVTTAATWASATTAVATISNTAGAQGLATSVAVGTSAITATMGSVASSPDTLTVNAAPATEAVTTYHYDNYRTGWNQNEFTLNPTNVGSSSFGLLQTVTLDNQVDAQPLVVPGVNITAGNYQGTHDVVYVVTENDTVYAIDAESGTILLSPNFGPPVMYPTGCRAPFDGINSTPVIDLANNILYVMAYTNTSAGPAYYLHALDLGSLTDTVSPELVAASHTLTDGSTFSFNATYQRQRPALLMANGNVYAAFGSFCNNALSRGWLLGWQTGTLTPMTADAITDSQASDTDDFFATSIWMSGYGLTADDSGNVLFITGNSDYSGTTYDGVTNIQESVVKEAPDLSGVVDIFTPSNWSSLDKNDRDFGSGGVLVLPDQPGAIPHLAVAAGKDGRMFLMNEDSLGGYSTTSNNVLGTYGIGFCWCGQSYYVDPTDLMPRIVSSGGTTPEVWELQTTPSVALSMVTSGSISSSAQDPGFFTTISSAGTANPIIWALGRPQSMSQDALTLYAFNPDAGGSTMSLLFQGPAGAWPNIINNANLVPVVANGEVFVASYQQLQIFGLNTGKVRTVKKK
ncbi:MAG: choice-of-anchor D domain-containing protein [Candidatus Sulfotelmatobacter sp.]